MHKTIEKFFRPCSPKIPLYLFLAGIAVYIVLFFPGKLSADSSVIYAQALAHNYSDHHPPMMGYVWHYLNMLIPGPAIFFLLNVFLIWGCMYWLAFRIFHKQIIACWIMILPFMPQVLIYAGWVWKDLIFSYGYLFVGLYLAERHINKTPIKIWHLPILCLFVFFATAVKFQAQFILPLLLLWFFQVYGKQNAWRYKKTKSVVGTIIAWFAILTGIEHTNNFITHTRGHGSDHSWQYVKIFDLAGMSIRTQKMLIPKEIFARPDVSVKDLEEKWELTWDPLITSENAPLRSTQTEAEREKLLSVWWENVLYHPVDYLQFRISIWYEGIIGAAPSKNYIENNLFLQSPWIKKILLCIASLFAYIVILPLHIGFLILGYMVNRKQRDANGYAQSLMMITSMGLMLAFILLFKSLAATPRYICFTFATFYFALPFAVKCLQLLTSKDHKQQIS
ncbi:MAG: hypothetical protein Q8K36_00420 [Alphaproteobacteria bacterium]|nr:hypothetical protein [Alphaproteobacteria bacterium]